MTRVKALILAAMFTIPAMTACGASKEGSGSKKEPMATPTPTAVESAGKPSPAGGPIEITVTETGFQPDKISVKKGEPVTFAFTRTTDKTCAKEVIFQVSPTEKIEKQLPLNERVVVTATFPNSGDVRYVCGMNMITGVITVQ